MKTIIQTRTVVHPRHALITPDGHVANVLAGVEGSRLVTHISPGMGAGFVQSTVTVLPGGRIRFPDCNSTVKSEHVLYVWHGSAHLTVDGQRASLHHGGYVYLPPGRTAEIHAPDSPVTLAWFEKEYVTLNRATDAPEPIISNASDVVGQPFLGNPRALLQVLLPDVPAFDLAVNIFTYQPGAALPFIETHVMEHGLLMLSGHGIYYLDEKWYPVGSGDIIWMAPYCPQWFAAIGDVPASYLYYKDVNRPLLV